MAWQTCEGRATTYAIESTRSQKLACLHLADQLRHAQQEVEELRLRKDTGAAEYAAMLDKLITSLEELSA